jgi:sterol desaturase/sphingolipid hydroxylase (fatty acid hydroxylase superfamily)
MAKQQSSRLFQNSFLEALTHVHPITPLLMWSPVVAYFIYQSVVLQKLDISTMFLWAAVALLVWTLTEYILHRFVFHYDAKSETGKWIIHLFHGIHHDEPDDATRLVMPPLPAALIMAALYFLFSLVVPALYLNIFMAFFIIGYLAYDYIHYATHHFPMTSKVGSYLRKYHLRHHHAKEHSKYGVSNPLWDYVFATVTGPKKDRK